jgi:hypothetical protein
VSIQLPDDRDPQNLKSNPESLRVVMLEVEGLYNALGSILARHRGSPCDHTPGLAIARDLVGIRLQQLRAIGAPVGSTHVN